VGAQGIEAEIPQAWGISQKSPAEELKQKARFFAVKPQKMCYHHGEKVNAIALRSLPKNRKKALKCLLYGISYF
jgi:hypothetical protein